MNPELALVEAIHDNSSVSGYWMVDPKWITSAINHDAVAGNAAGAGQTILHNGVAIIPISGAMSKGGGFFGGTSTVETRRAIRSAVQSDSVDSIMLHIDSPGGTVAGTNELAADVADANKVKPVLAHIEDLGASAAFWVASQARKITANPTAFVGSLGVMAMVVDESELAGNMGVKVHVVSTGAHKGDFSPGQEVTGEQLDLLQKEVNDLNKHFMSAVKRGRGFTVEKLNKVNDGRTFIASEALSLGLIDSVSTFDDAFTSAVGGRRRSKRRAELSRRIYSHKIDRLLT